MAVETTWKEETVEVATNDPATRLRLHGEILPPRLEPTTPIALRNARRSLWILAMVILIVQPASIPIGHWLNSVARTGTDPHSVWERYASNPVPDVLLIGASSARADIDEPALASELSNAAGRNITVEKMGFAGQTPLFLDALMYRIMERPQHPAVIIVVVVGPELNAECTVCVSSFYRGVWDISDLSDPGFVRRALELSPNPAWLATGWALPAIDYYPSLVAVQCLAYDYARAGAAATIGRVPVQLQNPTNCELTIPYKWTSQTTMTQSDYEASIQNYRGFTRDFHVSSETVASFGDMVQRARAAKTKIAFLQIPIHPVIRSLFPAESQKSTQQLNELASTFNVDVVDLSDAVPDDPTLWVDTMHLNKLGADYFAPRLATALTPILPS